MFVLQKTDYIVVVTNRQQFCRTLCAYTNVVMKTLIWSECNIICIFIFLTINNEQESVYEPMTLLIVIVYEQSKRRQLILYVKGNDEFRSLKQKITFPFFCFEKLRENVL